MVAEVLDALSFLGLVVNLFHFSLKEVVLDMLELIIKNLTVLYIVRLVLRHNLFVSNLIIEIKFLGIHIEVNGKEKKHPSSED